MNHQYSISSWGRNADGKQVSRRTTSDAIVAEYRRLDLSVPTYLSEILTNGIRYSYEDFDALSAALNELEKLRPGTRMRIGKIEAH